MWTWSWFAISALVPVVGVAVYFVRRWLQQYDAEKLKKDQRALEQLAFRGDQEAQTILKQGGSK